MTQNTALEVLFAPAEFLALAQRDLSQSHCVVFDVLRATSSILTALANGALEVIPVAEIPEALALRQAHPSVLLAGERHGVRIRADQTGGVDFDLGNSPREFTPAVVQGKTVVISTTNGTRALRSCAGAKAILLGTFLGLGALADHLRKESLQRLVIVCAGTIQETSYEDTLAAGALCDLLWPRFERSQIADSAAIARQIYASAAPDLLAAMQFARNGRRLLANPDLRDDVPFCLQRDSLGFVAQMFADGAVRVLRA
jgi:2-phosphosulfolactate phosphatase